MLPRPTNSAHWYVLFNVQLFIRASRAGRCVQHVFYYVTTAEKTHIIIIIIIIIIVVVVIIIIIIILLDYRISFFSLFFPAEQIIQ